MGTGSFEYLLLAIIHVTKMSVLSDGRKREKSKLENWGPDFWNFLGTFPGKRLYITLSTFAWPSMYLKILETYFLSNFLKKLDLSISTLSKNSLWKECFRKPQKLSSVEFHKNIFRSRLRENRLLIGQDNKFDFDCPDKL